MKIVNGEVEHAYYWDEYSRIEFRRYWNDVERGEKKLQPMAKSVMNLITKDGSLDLNKINNIHDDLENVFCQYSNLVKFTPEQLSKDDALCLLDEYDASSKIFQHLPYEYIDDPDFIMKIMQMMKVKNVEFNYVYASPRLISNDRELGLFAAINFPTNVMDALNGTKFLQDKSFVLEVLKAYQNDNSNGNDSLTTLMKFNNVLTTMNKELLNDKDITKEVMKAWSKEGFDYLPIARLMENNQNEHISAIANEMIKYDDAMEKSNILTKSVKTIAHNVKLNNLVKEYNQSEKLENDDVIKIVNENEKENDNNNKQTNNNDDNMTL